MLGINNFLIEIRVLSLVQYTYIQIYIHIQKRIIFNGTEFNEIIVIH